MNSAREWSEANQALLGAELAALEQRLADAIGAETPAPTVALAATLDQAQAALPADAAIDQVAGLFGLSSFERQLLLLCCGVEMNARLGELVAQYHGLEQRRNASFGLALAVLEQPHWSALAPARPLRRWRLLEVEPGPRLVDSALRMDERILHFVAGIDGLDQRLRPLLRRREAPALLAAEHAAALDGVAAQLTGAGAAPALVHFEGNDADGQLDLAAAACQSCGLHLYILRSEDIPAAAAEQDQLRLLWEREARLLPGVLLIQAGGEASLAQLGHFADRVQAPLFVCTRDPLALERRAWPCRLDKPGATGQKQLWLAALGEAGTRLDGALDTLSGQFRLSARQIARIAADSVPAGDTAGNAAGGDALQRRLWQACRHSGRERLEDLAEHIDARAGWEDLILPPAQAHTLRQISAHLRQRLRVYEDWGFARHGTRGLGVSALFCGESGTGKTLAAEVLARELALDLYRVDLSSVVSKYIGETEKNLRRVFDAAEDSGAVLLFDEADALFGKRSEVKDSHDRYANIEVSYLLQRMESYRGLAVLTTNMRSALDRAFQRRLRFVVNFPFPDVNLREAIWRRAFPARAPLDGVDYAKLARLNLPGGNIRNIALNSAFLAADAGEALGMRHLLQAAQAESAKVDRPLTEGETRGWL